MKRYIRSNTADVDNLFNIKSMKPQMHDFMFRYDIEIDKVSRIYRDENFDDFDTRWTFDFEKKV